MQMQSYARPMDADHALIPPPPIPLTSLEQMAFRFPEYAFTWDTQLREYRATRRGADPLRAGALNELWQVVRADQIARGPED